MSWIELLTVELGFEFMTVCIVVKPRPCVLEHRPIPRALNGPRYASITAYLGNRRASAHIQRSYADAFHLPPFWTATEVLESYGHYGTNWGATLQALTLGTSGLRLGELGTDPRGWSAAHTATLPAGWSSLLFGAWLGGERYRVVATHGAHAAITLLDTGV